MSAVRAWLAEGTSQRWLTGAAVLVALGMIAGLVLVVLQVAGSFFWPKPLLELTLRDGRRVLGEAWGREDDPSAPGRQRVRIKVGNRDITGMDFVWIAESDVIARREPADAWLLERREYGNFYGRPLRLETAAGVVAAGEAGFTDQVQGLVDAYGELTDRRQALLARADRMHAPVARLERLLKAARQRDDDSAASEAELAAARAQEAAAVAPIYEALEEVQQRLGQGALVLETAGGQEREVALAKIVRVVPANALSTAAKLGLYADRWWEFVACEPRESNTEGGILPALFGTALMVMLMTVVVVPLGVVAAVYLNEYARDTLFTKAVRLALANLAGVPSIVFGAFGLAFLVYTVGGAVDRVFFSQYLPTPTFGTGGILWAALTLALLTVPVVVIATEEGLQAVPQAVRDGARALGATRWQSLRRVVLPYALPGILTGAILAVARGAGEVAPLMLTGVVKLAPDLPLDSTPPFLHLDRKFMHLGFHIYDVGFQSPNVEAAKPMVYTTVLVLLVLVVLLNIAAILLRNRLRRKLRSSAV